MPETERSSPPAKRRKTAAEEIEEAMKREQVRDFQNENVHLLQKIDKHKGGEAATQRDLAYLQQVTYNFIMMNFKF